MQQQRASLKRHATAGSWVSALVPPGPAAAPPQAAAGGEHRQTDVSIPAGCQKHHTTPRCMPSLLISAPFDCALASCSLPLQAKGLPARRSSWHQHHERQQQQGQQGQQGEEADARIEFSDLEVHRQVGSGQFGVVRLVRHLPTGRLYALKVGAMLDPRLAVCITRS